MPEVTELLFAARSREPERIGAVFELVYPELKRLASRRASVLAPDATVTTTALVHETYLKLVRSTDLDLRDRRHFFACAAQAMRQIVVDHARAAFAAKRGSGLAPIELPAELGAAPAPDWLDLDRALGELEEVHPELRELVELRYFAGLTREEVAELLGITVRTVERHWQRARAFLYASIEPSADTG
jgi:RNA polymerase sigma factor (TIGR02999 family)